MNTQTERRATVLRVLRWAAVLTLISYLLYLIAANVFLNSAWGREVVNRKPEKFRMEWTAARSVWPGVVQLRELRLRGHVRHIEWTAQATTASGRIALLPLLRRQVLIPDVRAENVSGSVARIETEMPPPPFQPGGWSLRIEHIRSDSLHGGQILGWQLTGKGQADVGFSKQFRGGPMQLFDSSVSFADASLAHGERHWLQQARIDGRISMPAHRGAEHPGMARLALLDATVELKGRTVGLQSRLDDEDRYRFDLVPGAGAVEARLNLVDGALANGDRLALQMPLQLQAADGSQQVQSLDAQLAVEDGIAVHLRLPQQAGQQLSLNADLQVPGNTLPLRDWRERVARTSGNLQARGHLPSIGGIVALFARTDWLRIQGNGDIEADLQLAQGQLVAGSRLLARKVEASADLLGNRFRGSADADALIDNGADGQPRSRFNLSMRSFSVAPLGTPTQPYVTGNDLRVDVVSDARLQHMPETAQARVRFKQARIPDLALFNPYLPNDKLRFSGGSGLLTGDLNIEADGDVGQGSLRVDARNARMTAAGIGLGGDVLIDGRLRRGNLQRGNFELAGSRVEVRNVAFDDRNGGSGAGWWAKLDMDNGHVAWRRPSSAGGELRAQMKNVGFLLDMFAQRAEYPAWIGKLIDAGETRVQGRWDWRDKGLVLDRVHAANDRFTVDARLRLQDRERRGDLYASWGILSVAVELEGDQRKLHLLQSRKWYDSRPNLLP